ncbi:BAG domain-containing protein starvin isoform X2 [Megachile rotundata]|uniref:BAG domain-containing protein starvin isoform X2 n=1 Tax=Megachile rotundata TaxID=143995 RepID=UPI0006152916|nr:PREDICTED: BAG domain-containing protein Samui-like isoform X2 [Megachile rotundata]
MDSPVIVDKASEFGEPIDLDHPFPGFPFDDEGFGRRSDIRAHLDDLAARHPEFADHLLGPPWGDIPFQSSFRNRNHHRGSGNGYQQQQQQGYSDEDARSQASGSSATSGASVGSHGEPESNQYQEPNHRSHDSEHTPKKNQIPQYGLRNTVDIGQHRHNMENPDKGNRGQRSMSAPPENRQSSNQQQPHQEQQTQQQPTGQRYVSRIDITPQHNQPQHQQHQQQQQPQQQQSQKPQQQQGNVRHIPIFVEGRDEPVLPRSFDEKSNFRREPSPTQFHAPPPHFQRSSPFGDVFAGRHQWSPHFQDTFYQQPTSAFEHPSRRQQQQQPHSFQQSRKPQQQNYEQAKSQQKPRQQSPQAQQQQQEPPPPKPKPTVPKDPLERVALIQKEIDSLAEQVKQYNGNSRTDKQYIYLDEMLTRQLIKLDDIETEGRDNVRQARKNAIKTIQETIGLLESKAPLPSQQTPSNEQEEQDKQLSTDADNSGQITDSMDIDQRPEDQTSNKDATTTTATATTTTTTTTSTTTTNTEQPEVTEADRKTTEIQSKEPIPLPPPCPSSEEKSCTNDADHRTLEMDVAPSQTPSEPMDTGSTEKSKPTDSQQTASTEEKVVEVENTVDETSKKPEDEAERRKSDKGDANKTDTSEEMKKEETEKEKKSRQQEEEQQRQKGDEKMDVDNEVKQSPKTQKKGKKTKKQQTATTSDKPIPLPAPESTADSNK